MIEGLETMANLNIPKDLSSEAANKYLLDACAKFDVKCPPPQTTTRLLDKVSTFIIPRIFNVLQNDELYYVCHACPGI